jgi:hypothetical protein
MPSLRIATLPRCRGRRTPARSRVRLRLLRRGLVFRLRLTGRGAELTLKAADQDCKQEPSALLPAREGKCEYDLHGSDFKGAVSLTRRLDEATSSPECRGLLS